MPRGHLTARRDPAGPRAGCPPPPALTLYPQQSGPGGRASGATWWRGEELPSSPNRVSAWQAGPRGPGFSPYVGGCPLQGCPGGGVPVLGGPLPSALTGRGSQHSSDAPTSSRSAEGGQGPGKKRPSAGPVPREQRGPSGSDLNNHPPSDPTSAAPAPQRAEGAPETLHPRSQRGDGDAARCPGRGLGDGLVRPHHGECSARTDTPPAPGGTCRAPWTKPATEGRALRWGSQPLGPSRWWRRAGGYGDRPAVQDGSGDGSMTVPLQTGSRCSVCSHHRKWRYDTRQTQDTPPHPSTASGSQQVAGGVCKWEEPSELEPGCQVGAAGRAKGAPGSLPQDPLCAGVGRCLRDIPPAWRGFQVTGMDTGTTLSRVPSRAGPPAAVWGDRPLGERTPGHCCQGQAC